MSKVCEYFFSLNSPWSYLGHQRLIDLAKKYNVKIEAKPCDLGKVFGVSGGVPLLKRAPQRQAYRLIELQRWSEYLGLPMHIQPTFFPVAPDLASKMVIAAQLSNGTEASLTLAGAILRGLWAEQKNIADADTLVGVAFDCELDGKALLKSADTASVQAELDRFTNEANSANVFGAPWYVYQGEGYWGQDRLDFLERAFQKS